MNCPKDGKICIDSICHGNGECMFQPQPAQDNQEAAEQAAEWHSKQIWKYGPTPSPLSPQEFCRRDFLAGAKWQKAEDAERRLSCGHPGTYGFGSHCAICERDALKQQVERLREALKHYSSDAMRIGSTISPRHADAALAAFPSNEGEK